MKKLLLALGLVLAVQSNAWSALSEGDRALQPFRNLLTNPGAELGKAGWAVSTGSFAASTTTPLVGGASFTWDAGAAAETFTSTAVTIPEGWKGRNGVVSCSFLCASGTCTHTIKPFDGTNDLATAQTITSSTTIAQRSSVNFIFPTSGSVSVRISSAANEPSLKTDSCVLALAEGFNLQNISQSTLVGTAYYATTASCNWTRTNTALGAPATTAACPGPTVETNPGPGTIQTTDNDLPQFTVNNLPPGTYWVSFDGTGFIGTSAQEGAMAINDGTTTFGQTGQQWALAGSHFHVEGAVTYTATANQTFKLFFSSAANQVSVSASTSNENLHFTIIRFPTSAELAYRPEMLNWKVDANIAGANPSLGTGNTNDYANGVLENASLTLTNNTTSGNNVLTAMIPCSSTNAPTGTTCAVGNEAVGVSFTLPIAGDVEACVAFMHQGDIGGSAAAGGLDSVFQIVETPNAAQTISQEGKERIDSYSEMTTAGGERFLYGNPMRICGTFNFSSAGQKTLRLRFEQLVSNTVTSSVIIGDAGATLGQRDIHWTVRPLSAVTPVVLTTNPYTARYTTNTASSIVTDTIVNFEDIDFDPSGMVTIGAGWVATAKVPGTYQVSVSMSTSAATCANVDNLFGAYLAKNGATSGPWIGIRRCTILGSNAKDISGTANIRLNTGDTVSIKGQNNTGSVHTLNASGDSNHIQITRVADY